MEKESSDNALLEEEFRDLYQSHIDEIKDEINKASLALKKAEKLSEEYGIPFHSSVYWVDNSYCPSSYLKSKFKDLDSEVLEEIGEIYFEYGISQGWAHSSFCY